MIKYGLNLFIPLCMCRNFSKLICRDKYIDKYLLVSSGWESPAEDFFQIFFFFFKDKSGALSEKAENWGSCTESSSAVLSWLLSASVPHEKLWANMAEILGRPRRDRLGVG